MTRTAPPARRARRAEPSGLDASGPPKRSTNSVKPSRGGAAAGLGASGPPKRSAGSVEPPRSEPAARTWSLVGADGRPYESSVPGTLGGHRGSKIYGRLDCRTALWWIERGHYVGQRVFFLDEPTANAAGYRPCGTCMRPEYAAWKAACAPRGT